MDKTGCIRNTALTFSGLYFDFANPKAEQISIVDIAKALSNTCRFGGHCEFYSVAEHSIHCARLAEKAGLDKSVIFATLMHDAQEAYIGDMQKPLKIMMPEFQKLEKKVEAVVNSLFGVEPGHESTIKTFDLQMLKVEKKHLFPDDDFKWHGFDQIKDVDIKIECWSPEIAEDCFRKIFKYFTRIL